MNRSDILPLVQQYSLLEPQVFIWKLQHALIDKLWVLSWLEQPRNNQEIRWPIKKFCIFQFERVARHSSFFFSSSWKSFEYQWQDGFTAWRFLRHLSFYPLQILSFQERAEKKGPFVPVSAQSARKSSSHERARGQSTFATRGTFSHQFKSVPPSRRGFLIFRRILPVQREDFPWTCLFNA